MVYREKIEMKRCDWQDGNMRCETIALWVLYDGTNDVAVACFCPEHIDAVEAEHTRLEASQ